MEDNMFIRRLFSYNNYSGPNSLNSKIISCILCLNLFIVIVASQNNLTNVPKQGCFHNGTVFAEESMVPTMEPCLTCRCSNKTLICALRICPEQPIPPPRSCVLVKKSKSCCSHLSCSKLHTTPYQNNDRRIMSYSYNPMQFNPVENHRIIHGDNNLRRFDGESSVFNENSDICIHNGTVYQSGSAMSSSTLCSYCYCIEGRQKCVKPKCLLAPNHCRPVFIESTCCPVRYDCSTKDDLHKKLTQTQNHVGRSDKNKYYSKNVTRTTQNKGCMMNDSMYPEGQLLPTDPTKNCEICFCIRGMKRCTPKMCAPSIKNCTPIINKGECCAASYDCKNTMNSTSRGAQVDNPRQFDFLSMLFGLDEPENTTAEYSDYPQNSNYHQDKIQSTSEKSFFSAIRDGLDMIDNNGDKIGMIIDDGHTNKTKPVKIKDDNESLLDILLGPDEDEVFLMNEGRNESQVSSSPTYFQQNPHLPSWSKENVDQRPNITKSSTVYFSPWRNNSHAPTHFGEQQYFQNGSNSLPALPDLPPWLTNSSNLNKSRPPTHFSRFNGTHEINLNGRPSASGNRPQTSYFTPQGYSESDDVYEPLIFPPTRRPSQRIQPKTTTIVPFIMFKTRLPETTTTGAAFVTRVTENDETTTNFFTSTGSYTSDYSEDNFDPDTSTRFYYETSTNFPESTYDASTTEVSTEQNVRTTARPFITLQPTKSQQMSSNPTRKRRPKPRPTRTRTITRTTIASQDDVTENQTTRLPIRVRRPKPTRVNTSSSTEISNTDQPTRIHIKDAIKQNEHHLIRIETIPPWRLSLNVKNKHRNDTLLIVNTTENTTSEIQMGTKIQFSESVNIKNQEDPIKVLTPKPPPTIIKQIFNHNPSGDSDYQYDYNVPTLPPSLPNLKIIPFLPTDAVKNDHRKKINYSFYKPSSSSITEKYDNLDYDVYHPAEPPTIITDFNLNKELFTDYSLYNLNPTSYPNEKVYGGNSKTSSASIDDYHEIISYPSITENNSDNQNSNIDRFGYDNSDYDYGTDISKRYELTNVKNKYHSGINEGSLYNGFSPPTKTEGGFHRRDPNKDNYYYNSVHTTNIIVDMSTEFPLKTNFSSQEKTANFSDVYVLSENDKDIISITTDGYENLTIIPTNRRKNSTATKMDILTKFVGSIGKQNQTSYIEINRNKTNRNEISANQTNSEDDGIFGSVLSFLFKEDVKNNKSVIETETIPPFKSLPTFNIDSKILAENLKPKTAVNSTKPPTRTNRPPPTILVTTTTKRPLSDDEKETFNLQSNIKSSPKIDNINILFPHSLHNTNPIRSDLDLIIPDKINQYPTNMEINNYKVIPKDSNITQSQLTNPVDDSKLQEHTIQPEISSKPTSNLLSGLLKLAGCNIYGRMYRVGKIISELSNPCLECKCTEIVGVNCTPLKC